jgi:cytidine deaminase
MSPMVERDFELPPLPTGSRVDPYWAFIELGPHMVDRARISADLYANSYRGFKVGAAVLGISPDHPLPKIFTGANQKPAPEIPKSCAERTALLNLIQNGFQRAVAIVVAGPVRDTTVNRVVTPTLHPCNECQQFFKESPVVSDDTFIMTSGHKIDEYEFYTASELYDLHAAEFPDVNHFVDPEFENWFDRRSEYNFLSNNPESVHGVAGINTPIDLVRYTVTGKTSQHEQNEVIE